MIQMMVMMMHESNDDTDNENGFDTGDNERHDDEHSYIRTGEHMMNKHTACIAAKAAAIK